MQNYVTEIVASSVCPDLLPQSVKFSDHMVFFSPSFYPIARHSI